MSFTDFPNGLSGASDYLNPQNSLNSSLLGSAADIERFIIPAQIENTLKEIICSLLAGRGLNLPNIQICLNHAINELLAGITGVFAGLISEALGAALGALQEAFSSFMDHLNLNEVLGRINGVLGAISNIANMINFCSAPIDPIQIPNVLENAMSSFLGAGMDIMNKIGQISAPNIGGCTAGGFNGDIFDSGILRDIADNIDDLGPVEDSIIDAINEVIDDINDLIDSENDVPVTYDNGGSDLAEAPRDTWDGVGVMFNANDEGITGAVRNGSALWSAYQQLASYQVVDSNGRVYNNIFETFVSDDLLRVLRRTPDPQPEISQKEPVFNYCGEIVGYTTVATQTPRRDTSVGSVPEPITDPGFNAGGLPTNPITEAINNAQAGTGGTVINEINNVTNIEGGILTVADIDELLETGTVAGQLIYVFSNGAVYFDNGGNTGTLSDYTEINSGSGASTLGDFLTNLNNNSGTGILVRSGNDAFYRSLVGTSNQITITNGSGVGNNPVLSITNNPIIPGNGSMVVPSGNNAERDRSTNGALRYNTSLGAFEGYQSGSWEQLATGTFGVTDGSNVGGGSYEVYKQNNGGTLEFRTFERAGAITMNVSSDIITVSDSITQSNIGTGAEVYKERAVNDFRYRTLTAGNGINISQGLSEIEISATNNDTNFQGTTQTTDATATEVLFNGNRQTPESNKTWFFEITAVANRTNGADATAIKLEGMVDNNSGTVTIVGTAGNKTIYNSTASTSNYDLLVDVVTNQFRVRVQGESLHNVDWTVRYTYIEA